MKTSTKFLPIQMFEPIKETLSSVTKPLTTLKEWSQDGMQKRVYEFCEGSIEDRQLLGIKGSYLCEMSKLVWR